MEGRKKTIKQYIAAVTGQKRKHHEVGEAGGGSQIERKSGGQRKGNSMIMVRKINQWKVQSVHQRLQQSEEETAQHHSHSYNHYSSLNKSRSRDQNILHTHCHSFQRGGKTTLKTHLTEEDICPRTINLSQTAKAGMLEFDGRLPDL